jgi:hypothetical protein
MEQEKKLAAEAARLMGSRTSERKAAAARGNGAKGGRPFKPLSEIACNCGALEDDAHRALCLRGQAFRRRQSAQ